MCRIFGVFDAPTSPSELRDVGGLQRHGGPDAQTVAVGPGWALGSNRLAVVDLSGGAQPYRLGGITVVFNGELYNHDALRAELRELGFAFADRCDGSILPALVTVHGDRFAERLDGMYSIAVIDEREGAPRLMLATDDVGMKPLYHHWQPARGRLWFASELPALLGFAGVPREEWSPGLDAYLSSKTPFGEQTMFAGIRVLPPATTATLTRGGGLRLRTRAPYRPAGPVPAGVAPAGTGPADAVPAGGAPGAPAAAGLAEVGRRLRRALGEEVRRLLVADVPVAVITSGGLDSSLVTALAAEARQAVHTFNIAYTGSWPADERGYAREVATRVGSTHHQVELDPDSFPELLPTVVWHLGQPNADPITLSTYALFREVRAAGFTVALTGDAADELFGGYARMTAAVGADEHGWVEPYLDALAVAPPAARQLLYTDAYRAALADGEPALPGPAIEALVDGEGTRLRRLVAFEVGQRMPAYHLRRVDHLSMASSIEVRLPFCQPRIVALADELADEHRISGTAVKRALYAAAAGLLPDSVLTRAKQPFTLPVTAMLTPGSALWTMARDVLAEPALRADGRLRPAAVTATFARQARMPNDTDALVLWALLIHQLWRERFFATAQVTDTMEAPA